MAWSETFVGKVGNTEVYIRPDTREHNKDNFVIVLVSTDSSKHMFTIAESQALATLLENIHKIRW
jgi:hypothetical protein